MDEPKSLEQTILLTIVKQIVNVHFSQMIQALQINMGVSYGDVAGQFFSYERQRALKDPLIKDLIEYAKLEILFAESQDNSPSDPTASQAQNALPGER